MGIIGFIVWLVIGGIVGWLASLVMRTDAQQGILLNIVVGIVGAFIGGLLFGGSINNGITVMTFITSLVGAIILLAIVNLVRRGSLRCSRNHKSDRKGPLLAGAALFFCAAYLSRKRTATLTVTSCSPGSICVDALALSARIAIIGRGA